MSKKNPEVEKYIENVNLEYVNDILGDKLPNKDFKIDQQTIRNISDWALNGSSDSEIRQKLSLSKKEWSILLTICPSILIVMSESRALADMVIAGSIFKVAIGGYKMPKKMPLKVKDYDSHGKVCGEHYEIIEYEETLPPNPYLLKFLAEHKLSEKFGDKKVDNTDRLKELVENLSDKDKALIEMARKKVDLDGND